MSADQHIAINCNSDVNLLEGFRSPATWRPGSLARTQARFGFSADFHTFALLLRAGIAVPVRIPYFIPDFISLVAFESRLCFINSDDLYRNLEARRGPSHAIGSSDV